MAETIDQLDERTAIIDGDVRPLDDAGSLALEGQADKGEIFAQIATEYDAKMAAYEKAKARFEDKVEVAMRDRRGLSWDQAVKELEDRGITEPLHPYPELEETEEDIDQARINKAAAEAIHSAELTAKIEALKAQILDPEELERAITEAIAKDKARRELRGRDA